MRLARLELATFRFGGERSAPTELQAQNPFFKNLVRPAGLELAAFRFVAERSDPLSYGRKTFTNVLTADAE